MKVLLVLAVLVTAAFAGTRKAKPGEEKEALAMWKKYCAGGKEGGEEGTTFIHCKHALGPVTRNINGGDIDASSSSSDSEQKTQYIFVQPAPLHFNHNLQVKTGGGAEPKTIIYVRPAETSHSYDANVQKTAEVEHVKPELVFLDSSTSSKSSSKTTTEKTADESLEVGGLDKVIQSLLRDRVIVKV